MTRQPEPQEIVRVAIVDTETTGLDPIDEPISLGVILLEVRFPRGDIIREIRRYYGLRQPRVPIQTSAQMVHGITDEQLVGKDFDYPMICDIFNSSDYIIAHYADFDCRMMQSLLFGIGLKSWLCSVNDIYWKKYSGARNRKLDTLCNYFEIKRPSPHNALSDAQALLSLLSTRTGATVRSRTLLGVLLNRDSTIYQSPFPIRQLADEDRENARQAREEYLRKQRQKAEEDERLRTAEINRIRRAKSAQETKRILRAILMGALLVAAIALYLMTTTKH